MTRFRIAIIGAGPAGFYAAEHLLASSRTVDVDMYDRLPTPWGLVRAGVAPDHPKIKSVSDQFAEIAAHPRYRFFGNVEIGRTVDRGALLARYDAVLYAVGARAERLLGVEGEDLAGSLGASDFVAWYNGHPDLAGLEPDLSGTHAVVVGNGNVALDVARILLLPQHILERTDMADHALAALARSTIRHVTILGRRGAAQAAFTTSELREIVGIDDLSVTIQSDDLVAPADLSPMELRRVQRNLAVLEQARGAARAGSQRSLAFRFLRAPTAIRGVGRVREVEIGVNQLEPGEPGVRAVDTGKRETLPADLVIRAVGYRGCALPGVPFDETSGTIPHLAGAVLSGEREFVAGWIKRGPSGIIGTNRACAVETAETLLASLSPTGPRAVPARAIEDWLAGSCPDHIDDSGWSCIDRHERSMGQACARPRVKLVTVQDMVAAARRQGVGTAPHSGPPGP